MSNASWLEDLTMDAYDLAAVDAPDLPAGVTINNVIVSQVARAQSAWPTNPADSAAWEEADWALLHVGAKVAAP